jgi:hypothetical protein
MTYSSSLALQRSNTFFTRNRNVVSFHERRRHLGPVSNTILLIVLTCTLGLLYLTQVTKTNAYGYTVNGLQQQQQQLQQENDNLEVASARLQSVSRIQTSSVAQGLVSTAPAATVQD